MEIPLDSVKSKSHYLPVTPDALRAALDEAGIEKQSDAAAVLGVSEGAVSLWLNGKRPIPPMATMALASLGRPRKRTVQGQRKSASGRARKVKTPKN